MSLFVLDARNPEGEVLPALEAAFVLRWEGPITGRLTYLDTFDWRLARAGLTLSSSRKGRRVELRLLEAGKPELLVLNTKVPAFAHHLDQSPLRERLLPVSSIRRLLPRTLLAWRTRSASVLNEDEKTVARIRLRWGNASLSSGAKLRPVPPTLELLPLKGYLREEKEVRAFLWRSFGMRGSLKGEMTLVLEELGEDPGVDPSDPTIALEPDMKGGEAARIIQGALHHIIRTNQSGVAQDLDSEFLHDFRVAIRKTRAALGRIKMVFPPEKAIHFSQEFRWLGSRTGPARDMDVYLLKIPGYQESLPPGVRDQLAPLVDFLEHKKGVAHRALVRTLATKRYRVLLESWEVFLRSPLEEAPEAPNQDRPIIEIAKETIWKVYRRVLKDGAKAGPDAPAEVLHELRIECKRLRYLIGFFQSLFPPDRLLPLRKAMKSLQDNLGDFNDLHVQQEALKGFADEMLRTRGGPPETLMAMGRLMGQLEAQQELERATIHQRFKEFARPKTVKAFERLFRPRGKTT